MTEAKRKRPHVDKGREGKLVPTKVMASLIAISVLIVLSIVIIFGTIGFSAIDNQKKSGHNRTEATVDAENHLKAIALTKGWTNQLFIVDDVDTVLVIGNKLINSYYKYKIKFESQEMEVVIEVNYQYSAVEVIRVRKDN